MAEISKNESKVAIARGATWGTAAAGQFLCHALVTNTVTDGRFDNRGVGYDNFRTRVTRLEHSVDAQFVSDIIHNGEWAYVVAAFFGSEVKDQLNVEDYEHEFDLMPNNDGKFVTLSYLQESAKAVEIPSFKPNVLTIEHNRNEVGTFTMQGFASRVLTASWVNGPTQINALDYVSSQLDNAVWNGASDYFRINAQGDGALSSYHNLPIMGYTLTLTRQHEQRFQLRGADTKYTVEPKQRGGYIDMQLVVRFQGIDSDIWDVMELWRNQTIQKVDLLCSGPKIAGDAGNANASYRIQIPALEAVNFPEGTDIADNAGAFDPVVTFDIYRPVIEPAGMTGITAPVRMTVVNDNAADLLL